jgi:hypothetical protein
MSYTITLTDGATFATIADGTINTTSSMTLVGKNYAGYGAFLDTNFMRLLESASNNTAPPAPITGQLWWNNSPNAGVLSINTNNTTTGWKTLSALAVSGSAPSTSIYNRTGDLWYDTVNQQVNIWNGTGWLLIGPQFTAGTGVTGAFANVITDTNTLTHKVIEFVVNSTVVGVISEDQAFIPQSTISGFASINPGLQLANTVTGVGGTSVPSFWGQGNVGVSVQGNITANVFLGNGSQLTGLPAGYSNANVVTFMGSGNSMVISTTGNINTSARVSATGNVTGGNILTAGNVSATGNIIANPGSYFIGNGSQLTGLVVPSSYSNTNVAAYLPTFNGNIGVTNVTNGAANATGNVGNATGYFNGVYAQSFYGTTFNGNLTGTAVQAQYADLAERFAADATYEAGTVVELGGDKEITRSMQDLSETVFGVISTRAAYLMNSASGSDLTHPPVAMTGRVPVQCTGVIKKGDRLVSAGNGVARAAAPGEATAFNTIGRALADKLDAGLGRVEAIVTIK